MHDCCCHVLPPYSWWTKFILGGDAGGLASVGTLTAAPRPISRSLLTASESAPERGGRGVDGGGGAVAPDPDTTAALSVAIVPDGPGVGVGLCPEATSGAGTVPACAWPTEASMAGVGLPAVPLAPPAVPAPPAQPAPLPVAPAAAPAAPNATDPIAIAPPARNAPA